jgi:hypothetical protein
MSKRATPHDLAKAAAHVLQQNHDNLEKALPKFDALLKTRDDLRLALLFDYLSRLQPAKKPSGRRAKRAKPVHVDEHHRSKPRSDEERKGEMAAAAHHVEVLRAVFEHQVNGRPVGKFRWGELTMAVMKNAFNASSYLRQGTEATANALLLAKIYGHARVVDHQRLVDEILSPIQLRIYIDEARAEAPLRIEEGMHRYATSLEAAEPRELLQ